MEYDYRVHGVGREGDFSPLFLIWLWDEERRTVCAYLAGSCLPDFPPHPNFLPPLSMVLEEDEKKEESILHALEP